MAGGGGTRFWPLSRKSTPKQLLNLSGEDVMLNEAAARLLGVCDDLFVVTNSVQAERARAVTSGKISPENILVEPCARNTAACIGLAAVHILKKYGDGIMVVTPSDAYIRNAEEFKNTLKLAISAAEQGENLVTVGIAPTFPATGYGYIECGEGDKVKKVKQFVEKPDYDRALSYIYNGNFVWNSGMFVWRAKVILQKFARYLPEIYSRLTSVYAAIGTPKEQETIAREYPLMPSVSIDVGVMERAQNILVVPGEFGWSDVGSWDMLGAIHKSDQNGNVSVGDALLLDCTDTTVYSSGRLVAALGLDDMIIVETADAVMVCPRKRAQEVKKIAERLALDGREELL